MATDERPHCGGASLRSVYHDAHGVDDALCVFPVLLDAAAKAAGDSLRRGRHQSSIGMVLLGQYSGR